MSFYTAAIITAHYITQKLKFLNISLHDTCIIDIYQNTDIYPIYIKNIWFFRYFHKYHEIFHPWVSCRSLHVFIHSWRPSLPVSEVANLFLTDYYALSSTLSDVCTAYMLLLTLPVTVATCERSLTDQNFLRSTTSRERLSDLPVLPVENHRAMQLDTFSIVDAFAENGSLTNDVDVGVMAYSLYWLWKTTLLNIQYVIWLAVRQKPWQMMAVFCTLFILLLQAYVYVVVRWYR